MTVYDRELARLAEERNRAYALLHDVEKFANNLSGGAHQNVGEHLLTMLYEEEPENV